MRVTSVGSEPHPDRLMVRWASDTAGSGGLVRFQDNDGNLVVYPPGGGIALWASDTNGHPNAAQADGNVVIYDSGEVLWQTGTAH